MLRELARKIDAVQEPFGRAVSWLTPLMVAVVFTDVIMRYTLNRIHDAARRARAGGHRPFEASRR